jgi:sigma-B regulation protein RsbU (phosphoserine phosphatase)
MKILSRVIGVVYVDNRVQAGLFVQQDLELLTAIAAAAAIAIENARLFKNVQRSLGRLRLLHKISQELTATLELERVLAYSVQAVQELLGATAASILQIEGDELVFKIALGEKAELVKPFRIPHGHGIAGWVVEHLEPQIVNDVHQDERFFRGTDEQSGFITQSLAAAPLVINDKPVGVMEVFNKPGGFKQGDLDLLATFASAAAIAIENARLYEEAVQKGRMERELQMARKVQAGLLPQQIPSLPGWEFAARWMPAREVGGDYYDFVPLERSPGQPERLGVVIADVADKGTPAALFMASARSIVRASAYDAQSPLHAMQHANVLISADSSASMFITMFYGQLDTQTGKLTYINAGHNPPLLCQCCSVPQAVPPTLLNTSGPPLGIGPQTAYSQHCATLGPGDFLLCYTDGVTDALSPDDEFVGLER